MRDRSRLVVVMAALLVAAGVVLNVFDAAGQAPSVLERVQKEHVLRVGWGTWYPYIFKDPKTSKLSGFSYDLIEDLGKSMGARVEWIEDSWATMVAGIQARKFDMTNVMAIPPPRAEAVAFSEPVTKHGLSILVTKDKMAGLKSWQDLNKPGVKVAVTLGSNTDFYATKALTSAELIRQRTSPESIMALTTGKVDGYASTVDSLVPYTKEYPNLAVVPGEFGSSEVSFPVPKGDDAMLKVVNEFVQAKKKSGGIKALLDKYGMDASFAAN
jgi:ABC-type amino acid transport substrate-binding protein